GAGAGVLGEVQGHQRDSVRAEAAGGALLAEDARGVPRCVPSEACAGHLARAAATAGRDSGAADRGAGGTDAVLRVGGRVQPAAAGAGDRPGRPQGRASAGGSGGRAGVCQSGLLAATDGGAAPARREDAADLPYGGTAGRVDPRGDHGGTAVEPRGREGGEHHAFTAGAVWD